MENQTFKILIDAPKEKVWDILWSEVSYQEWTSVFSPGSRAESDWKEGDKILFLDGNNNGMVSIIAAKKPYSFMSFKHLGEVHGGVEDLESEKMKGWAGALENYRLKSVDGKTELTVDMDMTEEFKDYFVETWPKALEKLKSLAEKQNQDFILNPS